MNTFGGFPLREASAERARFGREELDLVTLFTSPAGREASCGRILLTREHYAQLDVQSTSLTLVAGTLALRNLAIVNAQCVTRGLASDKSALYLVELTDARGILANRWFQAPTSSNYNIRAPAYPDTFMPSSMNSGTTWTWSTMLQNLWEQMPLLGAFPGLPYAPSGTPEGFWFFGTPAWTALNDILDALGMLVACDHTTGVYTIVDYASEDAAFAALSAQYIAMDDLEWLDEGAGRLPKTVTVYFKRRNSVYGTEETVRYDSLQWQMGQFYAVPIVAAAGVGSHFLWSDFTVRYDQDGVPLAADTATATQIATERVAQYYARVSERMTRVYSGALPFTTGSQVANVTWTYDNGWKTKICKGDQTTH